MKKLFNLLALTGVILTTSELILKFLHSNICNSTGCILAASSLIIPDKLLILLGIITFLTLFLLSQLNKENLIDALLIVVLSLEGLLVGYQLFRLKNICHFCISIFFIFLSLTVIRLVQNKWAILTGILSFFAVLSMFSVLKPVVVNQLPSSNIVLIYKTNCPHCEKVENFLKENDIKIDRVNVTNCLSFLKSINITAVPALVVRRKSKIEILIGDRNIINFLSEQKNMKKPNINLLNNADQIYKGKNSGFCSINSKHCQ